jgi:hypothetical protein
MQKSMDHFHSIFFYCFDDAHVVVLIKIFVFHEWMIIKKWGMQGAMSVQ